jgi:hypothetical protein
MQPQHQSKRRLNGINDLNSNLGQVLKIRAILVVTETVILGCGAVRAQIASSPGTGRGLPETIDAIDSARVTTRILYITAHPDDESGAVLTYLARGLHADVALLANTRRGRTKYAGSGASTATRFDSNAGVAGGDTRYGVKLYFTSAKDFGIFKTPEETEKVWGDQVLDDMVYLIRDFRPNIIINNWGGAQRSRTPSSNRNPDAQGSTTCRG